MAIDWSGMWAALNERQQLFLRLLYEREREEERYYMSEAMMFSPKRKGGEWRWIDHQKDLCDLLHQRHQLTDPGEGSTWKALESRGYVERRWRHEPYYVVVGLRIYGRQELVLSVRFTRRGRQLVREQLRREAQAPAG